MSWFAKNYEKAAVGGAAVVTLGLATLGYLKVSGVAEDFNVPVAESGNNKVEVLGADLVTKATSSSARKLAVSEQEAAGRPVHLFTGIPLFIKRDAPDVAIDLYTAPEVHSGIPNKWWIEYRIEPDFADSPQRDPDGDGYSNSEEFLAKTSPIDGNAHPSLIDKLKFVDVEGLKWALRPGFPNGDKVAFKFFEGDNPLNPKNKNPVGVEMAPGDIFFANDPAKSRFKFLGLEKVREMNKRINIEEEVTYAKIEDQRFNKKGTIYKIPAPLQESRIWDFAQFDYNALLSLEAAGNEGKTETIPENTKFALPFNAKEKNYLLKKVTPEQVEVEYTDPKTGQKSSVTIDKGSFPTKKP